AARGQRASSAPQPLDGATSAELPDMVGVADRHRPMGGGDLRGPAVTGGAEARHVQQSSEERAAATALLR
ncbi:hypothetical protein, partial [Streptomyces mirabilis]